jgi:hypothetical protein
MYEDPGQRKPNHEEHINEMGETKKGNRPSSRPPLTRRASTPPRDRDESRSGGKLPTPVGVAKEPNLAPDEVRRGVKSGKLTRLRPDDRPLIQKTFPWDSNSEGK